MGEIDREYRWMRTLLVSEIARASLETVSLIEGECPMATGAFWDACPDVCQHFRLQAERIMRRIDKRIEEEQEAVKKHGPVVRSSLKIVKTS